MTWLDLGLLFAYLVSTGACAAFFSWLTHSILRLRQHEHRQNNALQRLILESAEQGLALDAIRRKLGA